MAFPTLSRVTGQDSTNQTTHSVSYPVATAAGDIIIIVIGSTINTPNVWSASGFSMLSSQYGGSTCGQAVLWRRAAGVETAVDITTGGNSRASWVCYVAKGVHPSAAPVAGTPAYGSSNTPNPPALTPGWTADTAWIAAVSYYGSNDSNRPANYANQVASTTGYAVRCTGADRNLTAASEDPGTFQFTPSGSYEWVAQTIAIRPAVMNYPVVEATNGGGTDTSTTFSLPLPAGIVAGNLLIIAVSKNDGSVVGTPTGWSASGCASGIYVFTRIADETEGASVAMSGAGYWGGVSYRISGSPGAEVAAPATGASGSANPPSESPSWGAADTLWLAVGWCNGTGSNFTVAPANYTNLYVNGGAYSGFGTARRIFNATADDPGTFTGPAMGWRATTIAISPVFGTTFTKTLTAAVTFSAGITKVAQKPLAGSITPSGSIAKKALKALAGSITPAGTVAKTAQKALAGSVSFVGSVVADHIFVIVFEAAITFAGSITKQTQKVLSGSLVPAASISIGRLIHAIAKISDAVTWLAKSAHLPFAREDQDIHTAKAEITSSATVIAVTTHEKVT